MERKSAAAGDAANTCIGAICGEVLWKEMCILDLGPVYGVALSGGGRDDQSGRVQGCWSR